ncbi:DUF1612 and helix-turn-helix domain-containing protein [Agrobacterium larrymoorei]|uniref:RHE_PE00001 family protein n=1 Tax=Agrobacterium larrymoorei TaxID=160699 RepID=UPI0015728BEC|nr:RHE_PE00001 family protein [Agrobacterium larrymoorei]NTJ44379.1 DUF1612 and helix-turn-helix domain-containing protein [Agrobacterium larrymoorei]
MADHTTQLSLSELLNPLVKATEALARLDERVARSPIRTGFLERQDFFDAVSSLWLDGELVHIEDLALHDAQMDVRAPTHEMINAHRILRMRRLIFGQEPDWALSDAGISQLRGKGQMSSSSNDIADVAPRSSTEGDALLTDELVEMDALLARSSATLDAILEQKPVLTTAVDQSLYDDSDWDKDRRLKQWQQRLKQWHGLPPAPLAAVMLDAWNEMEVLQRSPWLGRQLAAVLLRQQGLSHLPAVNTGLRSISRERRRAKSEVERLSAILDGFIETAMLGLKEHDRLLNAKKRMDRRLSGRRSNSRLPELAELVLARPVVSTAMIVKALGTTPQGAVGLANQLELREVTGRGRFRAWGAV